MSRFFSHEVDQQIWKAGHFNLFFFLFLFFYVCLFVVLMRPCEV